MANQFHSRLTEAELHRPERTGSGDPNTITLTNVRDGQYYQDLNTGSLYRYNESRDNWDLLIEYDSDNEIILNTLSQASVTSGGGLTKIGEITSAVGTEEDGRGLVEVDSIFADLFVGISEGSEIILQDENNPLQTLSLTVIDDVNAGEEQTIDVQGDKTDNNFPVGSILFADAKQQEALFSVDPTKVYLGLQDTDGTVAALEIDVGNNSASVQTLTQITTNNGLTAGTDITQRVDDTNAQTVLKTDFNGNISAVSLNSDPTQSTIDINADQINVTGQTTFISNTVGEINNGSTTIDGGVITTGSINANKLDVNELSAVNASTGNLNVDGTLTVQAGGSVQGSNYTLDDSGGNIAGWIIETGKLKSAANNARIELNKDQNRVAVFDDSSETVVMGYLDGLPKNKGAGTIDNVRDITFVECEAAVADAQALLANSGSVPSQPARPAQVFVLDQSPLQTTTIIDEDKEFSYGELEGLDLEFGSSTATVLRNDATRISVATSFNPSAGQSYTMRFTAGDYGFFAKEGDRLRIDGDVEYTSGDFLVQNDGSLVIESGSGVETVRLGTDNGKKGVFIRNEGGKKVAELSEKNFSVGSVGGDSYVHFSQDAQRLTVKGDIQASSGTIDGNLSFGGALTGENILVRDTASPGTTIFEAGDGALKIFPSGVIEGKNQPQFTAPTGISMVLSVDVNAVDNDQVFIRFDNNTVQEEFGIADDNEFRMTTGLLVQGDINYTGTLTDVSDRNLKENVEPLGSTLDKLSQLEAKVYDLVGESTVREIGLFAQDVEPLFPEAVGERTEVSEEGEETTYKTLSYIQLIPALIESVKELEQQNEELKTRIEALEQQS